LRDQPEGGAQAARAALSRRHRARDRRRHRRVQAALGPAHEDGARPGAVSPVARADGRAPDQLRPITITRNFLLHPEGSVLVEFGATKVICTATVEDKVTSFLKGQATG